MLTNPSRSSSIFPRLSLILALCMALLLTACGRSDGLDRHSAIYAARGMAIAASAKSQIGKPYRKGGSSPRVGFDCSGLVYWACMQNGISIPRTTKSQKDTGRKVTRSELRPGDIVIFKTSWFGYHTGIYLGRGQFIHSPRPRTRVRIDSLLQGYWEEHYVTARRVSHR